jgi:hypothetical protein
MTLLLKRAALLFAVVFAFSALAGGPAESIVPSAGPTSGGTEVTITGTFGFGDTYWVFFGRVPAASTTRVDLHTLKATTPAHLPGTVPIAIFEYDLLLGTDLTFTFVGGVAEDAYARILLPVFIPPAAGAHGAEFRTDLRLAARTSEVTVYGLLQDCIVLCVEPPDAPITIRNFHETTPNLVPNGTPGRFIYVADDQVRELAAHLRAYDVSREATNHGTELPVVRYDEDFDQVIILPGVPTDSRFRNNLRIYAKEAVNVTIVAGSVQETLQIAAPPNDYVPAYATWSNFPADVGEVKVTIRSDASEKKIWAFATVTNNDTQAITTVTPQP